MVLTRVLEGGRAAFAAHDWQEAFTSLAAADSQSPLGAEDLERLAEAAYLLGNPEWTGAWVRAHQLLRERGDVAGAVRCAFWLSFGFMNGGEMAQGGGWLARARRLAEAARLDSVECGYLLLPTAIEEADRAPADSYKLFSHAVEVGERFHDSNLVALARHGQGRALIRLGKASEGMTLLDEVLVSLMAGELSAIVTGDVYCGVVEACHETFDVRRAREWTAALTRWCESEPDLVAYRGQCMVYRAAVMQTHGQWLAAIEEAARACERLSRPAPHPAAGAAFYRRAELQRLRGEYAEAEESYGNADALGHNPQPGLALLRLAQGQADVAAASIRRLLGETEGLLPRSTALLAAVEVFLAAGDIGAARAAADDLARVSPILGSQFLDAGTAYAVGSVLLAEGDHRAALNALRRAQTAWAELDTPYEAARARTLIGSVCAAFGDRDGAQLEWEAALRSFEALGAVADAARVEQILRGDLRLSGLTERELEILRLIATGKTNRAIADELVISEKTVARHVSNIFNKVGVSSRAGATAYAYEHRLV